MPLQRNGLVCVLVLLMCVLCASTSFAADASTMIREAGVTSECVIKCIKKYRVQMKSNKAFGLDPITKNSYRWACGYRSKHQAKRAVLKEKGIVLMAVNNKLVWKEELAKYLATPIGRGRLLYSKGEFEEAISVLEGVVRDNESDYYAYSRLGWALLSGGYFNKATEAFNKSYSLDKDFCSLLGANEGLMMSDKVETAKENLLAVTNKKYKKHGLYKTLLASCYASTGEYSEAVLVLDGKVNVGVRYRHDDDGYRVLYSLPGGPAALAGLKTGDIVVAFNGSSVEGTGGASMGELMEGVPRGSVVTIGILRDDKRMVGQMVNGYTEDLVERAEGLQAFRPVVQ